MATSNGKRQFEALGESWTLVYDINALCRIEDQLGIESAHEFQRVFQEELSIRKLRTLFACGLSSEVTEDKAGDIMQALGFEEVTAMIAATIQAAFPAGKDKADPKPKKPEGGTG